jgi:hypothetical protein|tara:strand:+ start:467 stop:757 length:291 start_codon:yes stop_codon:yes gene_type:complete
MGLGIAKKGLGLLGKKAPKKRSDFKLKNTLKRIQKTPDKNFKSSNPATEKKVSDRTGFTHHERKTTPVKGSLGKKTYKSDVTKYHRAHQRMGLTKD